MFSVTDYHGNYGYTGLDRLLILQTDIEMMTTDPDHRLSPSLQLEHQDDDIKLNDYDETIKTRNTNMTKAREPELGEPPHSLYLVLT